jgi:hypothetical protein
MAQEPTVLEKAAPGRISTAGGEAFPFLDPLDGSLWFSTHDEDWERHAIVRAAAAGEEWAKPETLAFSGVASDRAPRMSPDGRRLLFASNRPLPGETEEGDWNVWASERQADGRWSDPTPLPSPINSDASEHHASFARDGSFWFASNRPGGAGRSDLHVARPAASGWSVSPLGGALATELSEPDVYLDPDGRFAIVVITDREDGLGGDDLYLTVPENGAWSRPQSLGAPVNSAKYEYGPFVTPDGEWLWFTSHRDGSGDLFRIATSAVPALRELVSRP